MEKPINAFPGYEYKRMEDGQWHNMYRGVDLGKGGWVYSEPGIHTNVALLDVASMHPSSIIALNKLGDYTQRYADLKQARVFIKHKDFESASKLFEGKLKPYLDDKDSAKALSKALKLPLNAFFGISFASFENPARDSRDVNNIIALRGALFMKTLFDEIVKRGYSVVHVKTDSQKIPNGDLKIVKFIQEFARKYNYEMEHEATYDRMCLIDKAQYVAAYMTPEKCMELYGYVPADNADHFAEHDHPWTTTGDEFQHPYIFKTLFSGEAIEFKDRCETKTVKDAAMYLDMNEGYPDVTEYEKEQERRRYNEAHPDKQKKCRTGLDILTDEELAAEIAKGHNYQFIGRAGSFFPVRSGAGGGKLLALRNGKYNSVSGAKDYRWLESNMAKELHMEEEYDRGYFDNLIDEAIVAINKYGDFDRFIDVSTPYLYSPEAADDAPFALVPCGEQKYHTCMDCPDCKGDVCKRGYSLLSYVEKGGESK